MKTETKTQNFRCTGSESKALDKKIEQKDLKQHEIPTFTSYRLMEFHKAEGRSCSKHL